MRGGDGEGGTVTPLGRDLRVQSEQFGSGNTANLFECHPR